MRAFIFLLVLCFSVVVYADSEKDIAEALSEISGATVKEILNTEDPSIPAGYRRFEIQFEQPVDHFDAAHGTFRQRLALLHKSYSEPLVLQTSGYKIFGVKLSALAQGFGTNQIQVEHRFFDQSVPAVMDWSKLDILQSAHDFHRITEEFKKIYKGPWVNTGASKGGMTSVYHRRFFPNDVQGTVADVAPLSFSTEDPRYISFVNEVGGDTYKDCREKLRQLQRTLLQRRAEILPLISGSFVYLGGKSVAFEHAVIELAFLFWQYLSPEDPSLGCVQIPSTSAEPSVLARFVEKVSPLTNDTDLFVFMPYYFQAAVQLGAPASELQFLDPYKIHDYRVTQYAPPGLNPIHSDSAMRDIARWASLEARDIVFVYGEFDPWSAGAFPSHGVGQNFHWFMVPRANHRTNFFALSGSEKEKALSVVSSWFKKRQTLRTQPKDTLDDLESKARWNYRLF